MTKNKHMPVSKAKNAYELLEEIREIILEEPLRYDQRVFLLDEDDLIPREKPACGTVGCVAGWITVLMGRKRVFDHWDTARQMIGVTHEQSHELFGTKAAGRSQGQTASHAKAGAANITRFMKKYAKQLKAKKV